MADTVPDGVSHRARQRQRHEMGTLGSGNHHLEVREVTEIADDVTAQAFGLAHGDVVVSIHCGSHGLGRQIGTDFLREMALAVPIHGIVRPDRELACAPIRSEVGERYLGAMRAGINCALANRWILTHLTRRVFAHFFPNAQLDLLFDVSHNTCKEEEHEIGGKQRRLLYTAKARPALSALVTPACQRSLRPLASRFLSAAAWAPARPSWSGRCYDRSMPSPRPVTVPADD